MSSFVFNIAKGKVAYYAALPAVNDALIAVPIATSGIEADATLKDHNSLLTLLAGTSNEQLTIGRTTMTGAASAPDDSADTGTADIDDFTWTAASGAAVAAIVICYVPDVGVSTDTDIIPLTKHDFSVIPTGTDIPVQVSSSGFFVATEV